MADPTSVPSTQRDDGLGHWHPAQRPQARDSHDISHDHDEQTVQVPLHLVSGADTGLDFSKQEAGLTSGTTAEHETTTQTAPQDDHSENQVSDRAHLHRETPYATDIDFPVHEEGIEMPERKEVRDITKQGNHRDSKSSNSNEDVIDIHGEEFGSPGMPRDEADEGQDRSQESATPFQPGLSLNLENQAATTISDTESSFGKGAHMDRFQRTNSFPDVPPLPQSSMLPHSLPHTQAATIMEVFEQEEALANGFDETYPSKPTLRNLLLDTSDDHNEELQNAFFPSSSALQDRQMPSLPDEEARFEEGLPLMHNLGQEDVSQSMYQEAFSHGGSRYPTQHAEEHFFDKPLASVSEDEDLSRPPVLDRKTTNQVLNSMQYPLHSETHDDPQISDERSSPADLTGDGNDVSPTTASSQLPSRKHSNSRGPSSTDEDLAALWQAALDDDELLDDDGEADPSSLFNDDAEGFLEDDQNSAPTQSASSPLSQPVYSPGGSMQGLSDAQSTSFKDPSMSNRYNPGAVPHQQHQSSRGYQTSQGHSTVNQQPIQKTNGLNNPFSGPTGPGTIERQQLSYGYATSSSRPQMPPSAQSFADKAKGGYTSPYDLPMDLSRPKKRNLTQQLRPGSSSSTIPDSPPAPPRSSSMFAGVTPVVESQPPVPTLPKQPNALSSLPHHGTAGSVQKTKASAGSFFEELPSVKPRPISILANARTHTANAPQDPPAPLPSVPQQSQQSHARQRPASSSSNNHPGYGLVPPGPISPYANIPHQGSTGPAIPSANARYSPAPAPSSNIPPSRTRYAASPAGGTRAPPSAPLPFQPRTSSPLAQTHIRPRAPSDVAHADDMSGVGSISSLQEPTEGHSKVLDAPSLTLHNSQPQKEPSEFNASHWASNDSQSLPERSLSNHFSPPAHLTTRYGPTSSSSTPSHAVNAPGPRHLRSSEPSGFESHYTTSPPPDFAPPRRSQTQSPGAVKPKPTLPSMTKEIYQRPASVNDRSLPQPALITPVTSSHGTQALKGSSQMSEYITPTDGRENDPFERWKGCPLFTFGFGGTVVTTFPKRVQRYGARHSTPLIKCSPGEVRIQPRNSFIFDSKFAGFPGPLKAKGKKKEVLDWLQRQIQQLEQDHGQIVGTGILPDPRTRSEDKILLWKIINVLVEHDGVMEGKPTAEKAIRLVLSPELLEDMTPNMPVNSNSHLLGISGASGSRTIPTSTELGDVEILRRLLLQGERDKAVWHAVDRRLWAHAMLISSTMDKSIWKQVLQEFIRQEVKSVGSNTESLASLYQIFAGNWEESIDELVPPSARAGLQFVSKAAGTGLTRNALDGLDRWRETLTLALSNRTHGDGEALIALGRLLAGYGRVEAAHICFIFAKAPGTFGGSDDPQASVTLLGADHLQHPLDFSRDIDSILLTEVYEFACTILAPSPSTTTSPHFQAYKLYHAMVLAEHGSRTDAQEYCSVITSAMKSTTKLSPYYHSLLFTSLDDLVNRLRQAPSANSASWMSKPSLDKVSGSFLSRVNQFIAGEESDADSAASGKGTDLAAGPFAGVTGDTPNISRSPSTTDLYSAYASAPPTVNPIASTSRYAPGGQYAAQGQFTPRSSFEQSHVNLQDHRGSLQSENLRPQPPTASRPSSSGHVYQQPPHPTTKSSYQPISQPSTYPMQQESYPTPPSVPETVPTALPEELSPSLYGQEPSRHASIGRYQPLEGSPQPPSGLQEDNTQQATDSIEKPAASVFGPTQSIYQPPSYEYDASSTSGVQSSYEPPTSSLYEPPVDSSNEAGTQPNNTSPVEEKPRKKNFMDDDEDGYEARAAALLKQDKARKNREADEAFRKAAEADAQKGPDLKAKKSGWLGGWFGGAKKEGDLSSAQNAPNAPIKAKLGEESSFYYDKELKKWVNKKGGAETPAASSATPPPPKGPPSRAVSGSGAPPPRKDTDTPPVPPLPSANSTATPPISVTGPTGAASGQGPSPYSSNPASRSESPAVFQSEQQIGPSRGLGIATSGGGPPLAPPSRPATGMSNASSIDDLIGAPQARQGGTIKKGKKARGYIDVMAK